MARETRTKKGRRQETGDRRNCVTGGPTLWQNMGTDLDPSKKLKEKKGIRYCPCRHHNCLRCIVTIHTDEFPSH